MEVVVTTGAISCAKLQSNHHHQQTNTQFLSQAGCPSCCSTNSVKSTEGKISHSMDLLTPSSRGVFQLYLWQLRADLIEAYKNYYWKRKNGEILPSIQQRTQYKRTLPQACHYKMLLGTTAQLFQSESCLTLEQATYACGRGRHCEFLRESAAQGMGHFHWTSQSVINKYKYVYSNVYFQTNITNNVNNFPENHPTKFRAFKQ